MHGLLWVAVKRDEILVSESIERALASEFMLTRARHMKFWDTYEEISEKLGDKGIEFAAIKGVTNETRWYDEMGERPCRDVDIWIGPPQSDRFGEALRILCPHHPLARDMQSLVNGGYMQGIDFKLSSGVSVDMHADPFKLGTRSRSLPEVWHETTSMLMGSSRYVRVLSEDWTLALSVVHSNVDNFSRLLGVVDARRIRHRVDPTTDSWLSKLALDGLQDVGASAMHALEASLGSLGDSTPIPGGRAWIWSLLWPLPHMLQGDQGERWRLRQLAIPWLSQGRLLEALGATWHRVLPPKVLLNFSYPKASGPYVSKLITARVSSMWTDRWRRTRTETQNTRTG